MTTTESLLPTDRLIEDAERAARNLPLGIGYRVELQGCKQKLRTRTEELAVRLAKGEDWFAVNDADPNKPRFENEWLKVLHEYERCFDALTKANSHLEGVQVGLD